MYSKALNSTATRIFVSRVAISTVLLSVTMGSFGEELIKPEAASDIVCSYAPSQSKTITGISGAAGGAAATTAGIGSALGLTAVAHSSGALILSGSGGYIAGTLGMAIVAPAVITIGAVVGGAAVTVELLCAPKNHPAGYKKVTAAAQEFKRRTGNWVLNAKAELKNSSVQAASFGNVTVTAVKGKAGSLYRRVFRKSQLPEAT